MPPITLCESPSAVRQVSAASWDEIEVFAQALRTEVPYFTPDDNGTKLVKLLHSSEFLRANRNAETFSPINALDPISFPGQIELMLSGTPSWNTTITPEISFIDTVRLNGRLYLKLTLLDQNLLNEKIKIIKGVEWLTGYSIDLREPRATIGEISKHASGHEINAIKRSAKSLLIESGITNIQLLPGKVVLNKDKNK